MFDTPILLIIFKRPETTLQVFNAIKQIRPRQLFIAADGPRKEIIGEAELCEKTRLLVIENIDWDCDVKTLFQSENLGCGRNPANAITWFFEHVEEGIILEDDCIPSLSFFNYCSELLCKYRNDEHVYVIGGNNFQEKKWGNATYFFSAYGHIWGWATWRRAWMHFDFELKNIDRQLFLSNLERYFPLKQQREYWCKIFDKTKENPVSHIWDYQWTLIQWANNAKNIYPNFNLVKNIGIGEEATHTSVNEIGVMNLNTVEISQLIHPRNIKINKMADIYTFHKRFQKKVVKPSIISRIKNKLYRYINKYITSLTNIRHR